MKVDWSKYTTIEQLEKDIKSIEIQGATNVALAVVRGMEIVINSHDSDFSTLIPNVIEVGRRLAAVRTNEPLARNAVKYLETKTRKLEIGSMEKEGIVRAVSQINSEYLNLIEQGKAGMIKSIAQLPPITNAYTHCHSSTVEKMFKAMSESNENFKVACSETRPLYQGRITAQNLIDLGINTTLVVDSGGPAFVADRSFFPIDVVFIGADEITALGDVINKIGSYGIALAGKSAGTPTYVVASLLKINPQTAHKDIVIEMRNPFEVWENPPSGLNIYNPAFEIVPNTLITGYITEVGIVKPEDMMRKLNETYPWAI